MNDKKEMLKKIYALALSGVDGEKEQANRLLTKLLKKYSISLDEIEDINDNTIFDFDLEYHGDEQRRILLQTIYKVTNSRESYNYLQYTNSGRTCKTKLRAHCTPTEKIEIDFLFNFYKHLWEKEKKALLTAFFNKHSIFGELKDGEEPNTMSLEEYEKMMQLMRGLSDEKPLKELEASK